MGGNLLAYGCALVAVVFFGSNFVPVKKYETSDGVFFQFVMCLGIFTVGSVVNIIQGFPTFQPFAMLGGFLWCTGNMLAVPVIKMIGLSLGLLIWGATNMLVGWGSGTFGKVIGLENHHPAHPALNYCGVVVALFALALYTLLKNDAETPASETDGSDMERGLVDDEHKTGSADGDLLNRHLACNDHASLSSASPRVLGVDPLRREIIKKVSSQVKLASSAGGDDATGSDNGQRPSMYRAMTLMSIDKLPKKTKRSIGICGAAVAGIFFGVNFDPPQYLIDNHIGLKDPQSLDYVYSHFCGIFLTSTLYFLIYCQVKTEPIINPRIVVPGFISGIMWAIADTCWFYANDKLSLQVAFPLITSGPGFIAAMWGIFVYKEYSGKRNYSILAIAFCLTIASDVMIAMSS